MLLGYIFYGIALVLLIYIIIDLIRTRKFDTSDAIAALGIVVAILLALRTPLPNIFGQPTKTPIVSESPQGKLAFDENFDDGVANGITFSNTKWEIVNIDKTDKVLQINNNSNTEWGYVELAEQTITNGTVEYGVNLIDYNAPLGNGSGDIAFHFRSTSRERYVFAIIPDQSLSLNYQGMDTNDKWIPLIKATPAYNLSRNTWHKVTIALMGSDITVYFDGTKVLSAEDDRLKMGSMNFGIAPNTIAQFDDLRVLAQ